MSLKNKIDVISVLPAIYEEEQIAIYCSSYRSVNVKELPQSLILTRKEGKKTTSQQYFRKKQECLAEKEIDKLEEYLNKRGITKFDGSIIDYTIKLLQSIKV